MWGCILIGPGVSHLRSHSRHSCSTNAPSPPKLSLLFLFPTISWENWELDRFDEYFKNESINIYLLKLYSIKTVLNPYQWFSNLGWWFYCSQTGITPCRHQVSTWTKTWRECRKGEAAHFKNLQGPLSYFMYDAIRISFVQQFKNHLFTLSQWRTGPIH